MHYEAFQLELSKTTSEAHTFGDELQSSWVRYVERLAIGRFNELKSMSSWRLIVASCTYLPVDEQSRFNLLWKPHCARSRILAGQKTLNAEDSGV